MSRRSEDAPTMGMLLCKAQNRVAAEYALRDSNKSSLLEARVTLLADKDNAAALAFYERLGFEESALVVRRFRTRKAGRASP